MQLIEHIEILLSEYPCLSIPGFGGFVVHEVDAQFVGAEICPPRIIINFNRDLSHNDGLLVSRIALIKECDASEAALWIKEEVERYHKYLFDFKSLELGRLGSLSVNEEGGIVFEYNRENLLFPKFFGLSAVSLTPIHEETNSLDVIQLENTEKQPTVVLRFPHITKPYLRYAATVAAAIIFLFLSTPSLFDSRKPQTASIFFDSFKFVTDTSNHLIEGVKPNIEESTAINVVPNNESRHNECELEFASNGRFCVVVLSCPSLESAKLEMAKRKALLDSAMVVEGNGRFRVVVMQTNSHSKAKECLNFYKSKGLTDTWIHVSRLLLSDKTH